MELLTKELEKKFKEFPLGSQDGKLGLARVIVKYFNPCGVGTWLITEGEKTDDGDFEMFGYCHLGDDELAELGYVRLSELQAIKGPMGLGIERDLYFRDVDHDEDYTLEDAIYKCGFKVPSFLTTEGRIKDILLEDDDLLKDVVTYINSWDGSLRDIDFYYLDKYELEIFFGNDLMKFADAILEGNFNSGDDYFTIDDVYGYITTYTKSEMIEELKNNIDDIVERIMDIWDESDNLKDCNDELTEIMNEYTKIKHPYLS